MKNKKHVAIALVTAVLTIGGLSLAKAKMYRHHFQHKTGHFEKGQENEKHCWKYNEDSKYKRADEVVE
jgi:hypothetical protein